MAAITLTDVTSIRRGGAPAIRNVSLQVPDGAFCVLTGPVASGKSMLLRLIAGREAPTSGVIEIGDAARQSWRTGRHDVAELIDPRAEASSGNLYDVIARGLRAHGLKRREAEERALKGADALALGPLLPRKAREASSGELALATLARAFAHQPRALLFDEPFAGIDAARRLTLRRELRRLQRETGATVVYATHDQEDALALADLLVVMRDGAVVAAGAPADLYARPPTTDIARLVGSPPMNILPVRANQTGLSLEDGSYLGGAGVMTNATFAWLGVRPEHLFVLPDDSLSPGGARFPALIEAVEPAGSSTYLYARVGPHPLLARLPEPPERSFGEKLMLGALARHLHMFDAGDGARL